MAMGSRGKDRGFATEDGSGGLPEQRHLAKVLESSGGEPDGPDRAKVCWQQHLMADVARYGADVVVQAVIDTHRYVGDRHLSAEQESKLRWHGYAWWALPWTLFIAPHMLRLLDGVYHRAWLCELDGLTIDGHAFVNSGSGCCQVCGL